MSVWCHSLMQNERFMFKPAWTSRSVVCGKRKTQICRHRLTLMLITPIHYKYNSGQLSNRSTVYFALVTMECWGNGDEQTSKQRFLSRLWAVSIAKSTLKTWDFGLHAYCTAADCAVGMNSSYAADLSAEIALIRASTSRYVVAFCSNRYKQTSQPCCVM